MFVGENRAEFDGNIWAFSGSILKLISWLGSETTMGEFRPGVGSLPLRVLEEILFGLSSSDTCRCDDAGDWFAEGTEAGQEPENTCRTRRKAREFRGIHGGIMLMARRMKEAQGNSRAVRNGPKLGFEEKLWEPGDKLGRKTNASSFMKLVPSRYFCRVRGTLRTKRRFLRLASESITATTI
jgi:hypothetical protein